MSSPDTHSILTRLQHASDISANDATQLVKSIYADGVVSREEAELLFRLNDQIALYDASWSGRFIEAVKDFLLTRQPPEGWVTEAECNWLIAQVTRDGKCASDTEVELLLSVLRHAEGAPEALSRFTLQAIRERAVAEGRITSETVEHVRRALYAGASAGATWVSRCEATALFELNDAMARAANDKSWNDLFARAIGNHLMAFMHPSPDNIAEALRKEAWLKEEVQPGSLFAGMSEAISDGSLFAKIAQEDPAKMEKARTAAREAAARKAEEIEPAEEAWFLKRLGWDRRISPAERALIAFLKAEAPGFVHGLAAAA